MKAVINNLEVECSVEEFKELTNIKHHEVPKPHVTPKYHNNNATKYDIVPLATLFQGNLQVPLKTVRKALGITKKKWALNNGYSIGKRITAMFGWKYDKYTHSFIPSTARTEPPQTVADSKGYMQSRHDRLAQFNKTARFFKVNPEQAKNIAQMNTKQPETPTVPEFVEFWTKRFAKDQVVVNADFFTGLANSLKDEKPERVRSYLRQHVNDAQFKYVLMPFFIVASKTFAQLYNLKGRIACTGEGIYLEV